MFTAPNTYPAGEPFALLYGLSQQLPPAQGDRPPRGLRGSDAGTGFWLGITEVIEILQIAPGESAQAAPEPPPMALWASRSIVSELNNSTKRHRFLVEIAFVAQFWTSAY